MAKSKPRKPRPKGGGGRQMVPRGGGAGAGAAVPGGTGGMDLNAMMAQVQQMQEDAAAAQESLADETVEATAGGGMVTVVATANQELVSITIDPDAVDPDDVDMLQDLVLAGVNEALRLAKARADEKMQAVTGGLDLGGLGGAIPGLGDLGGLLG